MAALSPPNASSNESGQCAPPPLPQSAKSLSDIIAPPPLPMGNGATHDQPDPIHAKSSSVEEDGVDEEQVDEDQPLLTRTFLHTHSSWLTSLIVHCSLLMLLALMLTPTKSKEKIRLSISQSKSSEDFDNLDAWDLDTELYLVDDLSVDFESLVPDPDFLEPESVVLNDSPGGPVFEEFALQFGSSGSLHEGSGTGVGGTGPGDLAAFHRRLVREGGRTGDVQISLLWNNYNDLDLHVKAPSGEEIFFGNEKSACNGELDVDANVNPVTDEPVENIYWPKGRSPRGKYVVMVHYFRKHSGIEDPTYFEVRIEVGGYVQTYSGTLSAGDPALEIATFDRDTFGEYKEDWDLGYDNQSP